VRERAAVLGLLDQLRARPLLRETPVVVIIECCMGIAASHISRYFDDAPNVVVMFEGAGGREGVPKSLESTEIMKSECEALMEQDALRFVDDATGVAFETPFGAERDRLFAQLSNLRYEALPKANPHDEQRYKLTGKSGATADDLLIATLMCPYWRRRFWASQNTLYEGVKETVRARALQ
jgi:hypothetical protein